MLSNKKYIYFCKKNRGFISDKVNSYWNTGRQRGCAGKHIYHLICKKNVLWKDDWEFINLLGTIREEILLVLKSLEMKISVKLK